MSYRTDRCGPCMCGAVDCRSCGPAQGYAFPYNEDEDEDDAEFRGGFRRDDEPTVTEPDEDYVCDKSLADYEAELDARASQ